MDERRIYPVLGARSARDKKGFEAQYERSFSGTNSFVARWTLEELSIGRLLGVVMEVRPYA